MRKTLLTTFFNEEYMLPWWLEHHKDKFDHGILIDYNSNDRSVEIIKEICPDWEIVKSRNEYFGAKECDEEVIDIESSIEGWKVCMNVTEFLVGDYSIMNDIPDQGIRIPCNVMVDSIPNNIPNYEESLIKQKPYGIMYDKGGSQVRRPRIIHNKKSEQYPLGRHYSHHDTDKLQVLWYGWSPFNETSIKRKLQIQTRIPESDKNMGYGREHIVTRKQLIHIFNTRFAPIATNLQFEIPYE